MISIVIPTYEMHGKGVEFLAELVNSIDEQTYINHEIIVSDDSDNDDIQVFCAGLNSDVKYYKNPGPKGACSNLNNAILHAKGGIIKPMFQDDQFLSKDCLVKIQRMAAPWCVLTSAHIGSDRGDHVPYANEDVYELARGRNTFGSPSAIAWKRAGSNMLAFSSKEYLADKLFDENLKWLFDVDLYARFVHAHGQPEFIDAKVLIREWDGMATRTVADGGVRVAELEYIESKYKNLRP